jgi:formylmethanofuran dehydrogenase subunit B
MPSAAFHLAHFDPEGKFVPNGRKGRTMVLVDIRETPKAKAADTALQIRPGRDFPGSHPSSARLVRISVNRDSVADTGLTLEQLDLVEQMKQGIRLIFFGMGVPVTRGKHMNSAWRS